MKRFLWGALVGLLFAVSPAGAQSAGNLAALQKAGETYYETGDYVAALSGFQRILASPSLKEGFAKAYFWIAKTYLALLDYGNAEKNLEFFLSNYPKDPLIAEAEYQKGRLLFYQGEYEKSIQVLGAFMERYGETSFSANSLFWIGESAFNLGRLEEARNFFTRVVSGYPNSFKVEAARYRLALIELKGREEELIKLLKWSHEESLNALDEFQRREKSYQQSIQSYQKKILELQTSDLGTKVALLEQQIKEKDTAIKNLKVQIASGGTMTTTTGATAIAADGGNLQKILELKAKALELKKFYMDWMEKNGK